MLGKTKTSNNTSITLTFHKGGKTYPIVVEAGASLLQIVQEYGLDVEGACEGNMACATCHMIFDPGNFSSFGTLSEEEEEMLDIAVGLTPTSRLGCQVIAAPHMDGWAIHIPDESGAILGF